MTNSSIASSSLMSLSSRFLYLEKRSVLVLLKRLSTPSYSYS